MSASNTDRLRKGYYGSSTTLSASIGNTDTTIPFSSTTGWPTDTAIDVTIDRVDASGNKTPTKRETITVVISSLNGINALRGIEGTAQSHSAGAIVEITFTAATHNNGIDWALVDHSQQGQHKQLTDTNGNTILSLSPVANAVNEVQVSNAATGTDPVLQAAGSDASINFVGKAKGPTGAANLYNGDGSLAFGGKTAWQSWTPTWTNFTLGNGTATAKYIQIGKTVFYKVYVTLGSTSSVSGAMQFSLPATMSTVFTDLVCGQGSAEHAAGALYWLEATPTSSTVLAIYYYSVSGAYVVAGNTGSTLPFTWASTDTFAIQGFYEAA